MSDEVDETTEIPHYPDNALTKALGNLVWTDGTWKLDPNSI